MKIERVWPEVLEPLNDFVAVSQFRFPLDRKYFGRVPLLVEFNRSVSFCLTIARGVCWLGSTFEVKLPFTLPEVVGPPGNINDETYYGIDHFANVAGLANNFSVFKVLGSYFGSRILLTTSDLMTCERYVSFKDFHTLGTVYRVFVVNKVVKFEFDDPIFREDI